MSDPKQNQADTAANAIIDHILDCQRYRREITTSDLSHLIRKHYPEYATAGHPPERKSAIKEREL